MSPSPATAPKRTASASSPSISANGRYVTYASAASNLVPGDTNAPRTSSCSTGRPTPPSASRSPATAPKATALAAHAAISANGRYVTYSSDASNLVPGDTNGAEDIFVFDRKTDTTERVSVASDGTEANSRQLQSRRFRRMAAL